ncbi:MAG TPA: hypothetical protein VFK59_12565 [Actinomycetota bacterium]|nr:hypothetical protein [Actinomycetota bacterium]
MRTHPDSFFLGEPAPRFGSLTGGLASFFDLLRHPERPDRPGVALAMAKLACWIAGGIVLTSASAVAVGLLAVRIYEQAFG